MAYPPIPPDKLAYLHRRYMAGETSVALAREFGYSSGGLRNAFKRAGMYIRPIAESNRVWAAQATAEERMARAAAAHDARRGAKATTAERVAYAATRERMQLGVSDSERAVERALARRSVRCEVQKAIGPYNADLVAPGDVAVEVFGGKWHGYGRYLARHLRRMRYIFDAGYHVVILWVDRAHGRIRVNGLDHVIEFIEFARGNPSAKREYRVVWSNGDLVTRLDADADDFPVKPTFELRRNPSTGRYERAR